MKEQSACFVSAFFTQLSPSDNARAVADGMDKASSRVQKVGGDSASSTLWWDDSTHVLCCTLYIYFSAVL